MSLYIRETGKILQIRAIPYPGDQGKTETCPIGLNLIREIWTGDTYLGGIK